VSAVSIKVHLKVAWTAGKVMPVQGCKTQNVVRCSVVLLWCGWVLRLHFDSAHSAGGFCTHLEPKVGGERRGREP